jgi:nucleotide-binding universal stress UspA family protein
MAASRCILVATDFSGTSREALHVARDLAAAIGARVHLLHVIPDPARLPWSVDTGMAFLDLERSWRRHAELALTQARDQAHLSAEKTTMTVAMGDAAHAIAAAADAAAADFIVVGTHGHGLVARLVMGSVADKVVRHATRPVLIVPHPALTHVPVEPAREEAVRS